MTPLVLITGATGYIGSHLLSRLERSGRRVRCLVRDASRLKGTRASTTEVVQGDCLDTGDLDRALDGVHTAYYLVHSMASAANFAAVDRRAAETFGLAAARAGVTRIIYLGGLAHAAGPLSAHLSSRNETGELLRASGVPVIEFRASIVIGAGSLSFEMIGSLVERLPVMICPRWVNTLAQPIAIDDVLSYLEEAVDVPGHSSRVFEIGGPDVVSYGDLMREYARQRRLRRWLLPVPLLTPRLSGLWLALVTPAHARVGRALVEGLRNDTTVKSVDARQAFGIEPQPVATAVSRAIEAGLEARCLVDRRTTTVAVPPARAFAPIRRLGGDTGWYYGQTLWRTRGWIDRMFGGTGLPSARRHPDECAVGDRLDGWYVEAYEPDRRLRLAAGMKLPGQGWLEFEVTPVDGGRGSSIQQTARFDPRGIFGRLYWYALVPVHAVIFGGLLSRLARYAEAGPPPIRHRRLAQRKVDGVRS